MRLHHSLTWLRRRVTKKSMPVPRGPRRLELEALEGRLAPAVITVTTTNFPPIGNNDGFVSLDNAIAAINAGSDLGDPDIIAQAPGMFGSNDTIRFNIPGAGVHTIALPGTLTITMPLTIDGYTQPGASPNTLATGDNAKIMVELDGTGVPGPALTVLAGSTTIRGLAILNAVTGIRLAAQANVVAGNFIGLRADGSTPAGNRVGVNIFDASFNQIGGTAPGDRNIISSNVGDGVLIDTGVGNVIQGNFLGTTASGTSAAGNGGLGVFGVSDSASTIGGLTPGSGNVISGNVQGGVGMTGSSHDVVQGNLIGTDASGTMPLGNKDFGIFTSAADHTLIGGATSAAANTIAFNRSAGIGTFDPSQLNAFRRNAIFGNAGLGIDLQHDGLTANVPNGSTNFPVLVSAVSNGASTTITGAINSDPVSIRIIDFYANATLDPSGFGQGQTYLGSTSVITDGFGNAGFSVTLPVAVAAGQFLTATATSVDFAPFGSTSEFAEDIDVTAQTPPPPPSPSADLGITQIASANPAIAGANLTYTLTLTNAGPSTAQGVVVSDPLPAGTTFVSATQTGGPLFTVAKPQAGKTGTVSWTAANLASGATGPFQITVHLNSNLPHGSSLSNIALVNSATPDPKAANNSAALTVGVVTQANLGVRVTTPLPTVPPGTQVNFTITLADFGPSDAQNVLLKFNVPTGTTFVSLSQTGGPSFACSTPTVGGSGTITCSLPTLTRGTWATFTLVVSVLPSDVDGLLLTLMASVNSGTFDPDLSNNSAHARTKVMRVV